MEKQRKIEIKVESNEGQFIFFLKEKDNVFFFERKEKDNALVVVFFFFWVR